MKIKATRKMIKNNYSNIINVGYANLQHLFFYDTSKYYNCGVYGWNWDGYELDENTCIITGYRNTLGDSIDINYIQEIDNKARKIVNSWGTWSLEDKKQKLNELKNEFLSNYKKYICK